MTHTYTRIQLIDAATYADDHALEAYQLRFMMGDETLDDAYDHMMDHINTYAHTPVQLPAHTSPNGEVNKYMIAPGMLVALSMDDGAPVLKTFMTPTWRQKQWMESN